MLPKRTPALVLIPVALVLLLAHAPATADEATDAWNGVAAWIRDNAPAAPTKSAMTRFRRDVAERIEAYLERYPGSPERATAERVLGETYLALGSYAKARALYETMVDAAGYRGRVGRHGLLKALLAEDELAEARRRLDGFLAAHPDDEDLKTYDQLLSEHERKRGARKELKKLRKGDAFPEVAGALLGGGAAWSLAEDGGELTLLGFWMSHDDAGRPASAHTLREVEVAGALHERYGGEGLVVIGIPVDKDPERLRAYIAEEAIAWPQLAEGRRIGHGIGLFQVPYWVLLDEEGRVLVTKLRHSSMERTVERALEKRGR